MTTPIVEMRNIEKFYGRIHALRGVNLHVNKGEIVGLLGDNGAGKSTLIKVLSGAVPYTSGQILINGKEVQLSTTNDAIDAGVETIYQDSALVPQLSIARNLFLGRELTHGTFGRLDQSEMNSVASDLLRRVGITKNIPPTTPISALSGGERQRAALATTGDGERVARERLRAALHLPPGAALVLEELDLLFGEDVFEAAAQIGLGPVMVRGPGLVLGPCHAHRLHHRQPVSGLDL